MGHPIHKHMHTHITKQNVAAAIRDDKAHMDYLKRDVKDDQRAGGKYKDINQTADEKHISKLAGDVKYDEKKEGMSRYEYEGMSRHTSEHSTEEYMARKDAAIKKSKGMSRIESPLNIGPGVKPVKKKEYSFGEKVAGTAKNIGDYATAKIKSSKILDGVGVTNPHGFSNVRDHNLMKSKEASSRAKQRKSEGSAFFRNTSNNSPINNITYGDRSGKTGYIGEERKDLMKYNPVDDRAGMSRYKREK